HLALRAVVLLEKPHEKLLVELVDRFRVHDIDGIDRRARIGALESLAVVRHALKEVLIGLPFDGEVADRLASLKGVDRVVVGRPLAREILSSDIQPAKHQHIPEYPERLRVSELVTQPRFLPAAALNAQEALT